MSLVLMCPSTLMQLKLLSTASRSRVWATSGVNAASESTAQSIVAMFGPIMAAPLARPQTCIVRPRRVSVRPESLWRVSVVIMPRAAEISDASSVPTLAAAALMPAAIFSMGKNVPITPVDITRAWFGWRGRLSMRPTASAARRAISAASRSPRSPVQALATPELTAITRTSRAGVRLRFQPTGAPKTRFCV